jgi:hypothetical protein
MLVLRLLSAPTPEQRPVWFDDELASLQKLPQLLGGEVLLVIGRRLACGKRF